MTESMFTMMVGWREEDREVETGSECESDVRFGRDAQRDVGDCNGLAPFPRGREKALKSPS